MKIGSIIVKIHSLGTNPSDLKSRIALIQSEKLRDFFLQPLVARVESADEKLLTIWPVAEISDSTDVEKIEWKENAVLLANLHKASESIVNAGSFPASGFLARLDRMHLRLQDTKDCIEKKYVQEAFSTLPFITANSWQNNLRYVIHGDWHPGKVAKFKGAAKFIDIDDIGIGNPAWDLARPAAWYLAGFLSDSIWREFLGSYIESGGPAVTSKDPWEWLELPARVAVIYEATKALIKAQWDNYKFNDLESELFRMCRRIVTVHG